METNSLRSKLRLTRLFVFFTFLSFFLFFKTVLLCHPGWSREARSQLTTTSTSNLPPNSTFFLSCFSVTALIYVLWSSIISSCDFFLRQSLALSPRLESSAMVIAHCSLKLLGSSYPLHSASWAAKTTGKHYEAQIIFKFFVETRDHYVTQAGLKLLPCDPPVSASESAGITGVSHRAQSYIS